MIKTLFTGFQAFLLLENRYTDVLFSTLLFPRKIQVFRRKEYKKNPRGAERRSKN